MSNQGPTSATWDFATSSNYDGVSLEENTLDLLSQDCERSSTLRRKQNKCSSDTKENTFLLEKRLEAVERSIEKQSNLLKVIHDDFQSQHPIFLFREMGLTSKDMNALVDAVEDYDVKVESSLTKITIELTSKFIIGNCTTRSLKKKARKIVLVKHDGVFFIKEDIHRFSKDAFLTEDEKFFCLEDEKIFCLKDQGDFKFVCECRSASKNEFDEIFQNDPFYDCFFPWEEDYQLLFEFDDDIFCNQQNVIEQLDDETEENACPTGVILFMGFVWIALFIKQII